MKRPFRGLRHKPPNDSYDAVIIGAGIGGLICANLLAREGLSVLLTEQHYMVGGYCSTFRRKGYTFDAATHFSSTSPASSWSFQKKRARWTSSSRLSAKSTCTDFCVTSVGGRRIGWSITAA